MIGNKILHAEEILHNLHISTEEYLGLIQPQYTDMGLIPSMYSVFKEINPNMTPRRQKLYFSYMCIMLYSPRALLDGRIINYLIFEVATTVGYKSSTSVTKSIRMWRMYKIYPGFKAIIDNSISAIMHRIKQSN